MLHINWTDLVYRNLLPDARRDSILGREGKKNNIQRMYDFAGGTDYRHLCYECSNCVDVENGDSHTRSKCLVFGDDGTVKSDWRRSNIACKLFGIDYHGSTVLQQGQQVNDSVDGQMSIFDFL